MGEHTFGLGSSIRMWSQGSHVAQWKRGAPGEAVHDVSEDEVRAWLEGLGLKVRSKAGICIFHDYLPSGTLDDQQQLENLLKVEEEMRGQEPFASLGQHLVCESGG